VRLGLVLAEIGAANNVAISDEELTNAARQEAMRYGPQAQEVFDYLRRTPAAQAQLRAPIYEDKVVDLIFRVAKVEDKAVSKDELMAALRQHGLCDPSECKLAVLEVDGSLSVVPKETEQTAGKDRSGQAGE